jgi:hypothetical protein
MGPPVCRGLRPVSVDEGILEVEDNWVSADPMFQYTSLAWISPRQVVVLARYYQSACQRKALELVSYNCINCIMYQQFSVVFTYFVIHVCHINIVCIYLKSKCLALAYGSIWLY